MFLKSICDTDSRAIHLWENALSECEKKSETLGQGLTLKFWHDKRTPQAIPLSNVTTDITLGFCISSLQRRKLCWRGQLGPASFLTCDLSGLVYLQANISKGIVKPTEAIIHF